MWDASGVHIERRIHLKTSSLALSVFISRRSWVFSSATSPLSVGRESWVFALWAECLGAGTGVVATESTWILCVARRLITVADAYKKGGEKAWSDSLQIYRTKQCTKVVCAANTILEANGNQTMLIPTLTCGDTFSLSSCSESENATQFTASQSGGWDMPHTADICFEDGQVGFGQCEL